MVALALLVAATTSTAAFGAYNPAWDGTSDLREEILTDPNGTVAVDSTAYNTTDPANTTALVLAPTEPYDTDDVDRVTRFLAAGGTLVVADDYGTHGNELLAAVGATARFDGNQLRDEQHYYRAPTLPRAINVSATPYTDDVEQLTLNGATAIEPGSATVVVATAPVAYLDRNQTGGLTAADELGRYPVVTTESVGDGTVIAVSDPSVFINAMAAEPDNQAFITALLETRPNVLLDYSQAGPQPVLAVTRLYLQTTPLAQLVSGILAAGVVWTGIRSWPALVIIARRTFIRVLPVTVQRRVPPWLSDLISMSAAPTVDRHQVRAALEAQYPDIAPAVLDRVMTDVLLAETESETNE